MEFLNKRKNGRPADLISTKEAANILGICKQEFINRLNDNEYPGLHVWEDGERNGRLFSKLEIFSILYPGLSKLEIAQLELSYNLVKMEALDIARKGRQKDAIQKKRQS